MNEYQPVASFDAAVNNYDLSSWHETLGAYAELLAKLEVQQPKPELETGAVIEEWQLEALDRTETETCFLWHRQELRGLVGGGLGGLLTAIDWLCGLVGCADDEALDGAYSACHGALSDARTEAKAMVAQHPLDGRDQAYDLDNSPIRSLLRSFGELEAVRRECRDGWITELAALKRMSAIAIQMPPAITIIETQSGDE